MKIYVIKDVITNKYLCCDGDFVDKIITFSFCDFAFAEQFSNLETAKCFINEIPEKEIPFEIYLDFCTSVKKLKENLVIEEYELNLISEHKVD